MNMMKTIKVTATPFAAQWAVECSVCDFMELVASAAVDSVSAQHVHTHAEDQ